MYWNVTKHSANVNMVTFKILREAGWCEKEMAGNESRLVAIPRNTDLRFNKGLIRVLANRST